MITGLTTRICAFLQPTTSRSDNRTLHNTLSHNITTGQSVNRTLLNTLSHNITTGRSDNRTLHNTLSHNITTGRSDNRTLHNTLSHTITTGRSDTGLYSTREGCHTPLLRVVVIQDFTQHVHAVTHH